MKNLIIKIKTISLHIIKRYIKKILCLFIKPKKTNISLIFHLNQESTPYLKLASKFSYIPAIKYILNKTKLKICLHISGTCLEYFQLKETKFLNLLKKNVKNNRIELLVSTYSQPIIYCLDKNSINIQINAHKKKIYEIFKIIPKGFWLPERVIDKRTINIIKENGFNYTIIEDTAIDNKYKNNILKGKLNYIVEQKEFSHIFNYFIANAYNIDDIKNYILLKNNKNKWLIIAEDLESIGLWNIEKGNDPKESLINLAKFCNLLKKYNIRSINPSEKINSYSTIKFNDNNLKSAAKWMEDSFKGDIFHFYENKNYNNWFNFAENSNKINEFRVIFSNISKKIENAKRKFPVFYEQFLKEIELILIRHQFEFGCIGINGTSKIMWEFSKHCLFLIETIDLHFKEQFGIYEIETIICIIKKEYIIILNKNGSIIYMYSFFNDQFLTNCHLYHKPLEELNNIKMKNILSNEQFYHFNGLTEKQLFPWLNNDLNVFKKPVFLVQKLFYEPKLNYYKYNINENIIEFVSDNNLKKYYFKENKIIIKYEKVKNTFITLVDIPKTTDNLIQLNRINKKKCVKKNTFYGILYCIEINNEIELEFKFFIGGNL